MFGFFRRKKAEPDVEQVPTGPPPAVIEVPGAPPFPLAEHIERSEGFPYPQWGAIFDWIDTLPPEARQAAWDAANEAWCLYLVESLGPGFGITHGPSSTVISSFDRRQAAEVVELMEKTARRIPRVLEGLGGEQESRGGFLIVFDDREAYYRYVSRYYPDQGEFAFSGGMHIRDGSSCYVTTRDDSHSLAPVLAHEMTHGYVGHLRLPLWLNEGLAVNTEVRLAGAQGSRFTPAEMRKKHLAHWDAERIQAFWSGLSYQDPGDSNMLSYDLGRILVEQLAGDWARFAAFARDADWEDAGTAAAKAHFGLGLGEMVAAILERESAEGLEPDPSAWKDPAAHTPT